jgi:farnesyl-diphosphate farnesyltransferase
VIPIHQRITVIVHSIGRLALPWRGGKNELEISASPQASGDACLAAVRGAAEKQLLKGVSRSFYLTLRFLPRPMRGAASLGYLLARTSDTLADSAAIPVEARVPHLEGFERAVAGGTEPPRWPVSLLNALADPRERALLEASGDLFAWLARLPAAEARLVREVAATIIGGQKLDLARFAAGDARHPVSLKDEAELEDYTWRVAGCVGEFWTKLGFLTLGARFSSEPMPRLIERGVAYGKGLQLVNILRDIPADLASGRCYLPLPDPGDSARLSEERARWGAKAAAGVEEGLVYAETLFSRRLRMATALPAMIARETLALLRTADVPVLQHRVKVPRAAVYLALVRAFLGKIR